MQKILKYIALYFSPDYQRFFLFKFPERYYQTDAGVTSLSFSHQRSNLLAVNDNYKIV
jgi:hypothetical protein